MKKSKSDVPNEKIQVEDRRNFIHFQVDNRLIAEYGSKIGPYGIAAYCSLAYHANRQDKAWPSYQTIADETGMSRARAFTAIASLVEHGLIRKEARHRPDGSQTSNMFILVEPPHLTPVHSVDPPVHSVDPPHPPGRQPPVHQVDSPHLPDRHEQYPEEQYPEEQYPGEEARAAQPPTPAPPGKKGAKIIKSPYFSNEDFEGMYIPAGQGQNPVQVYYERFNIFNPDERLTVIKEDDLIRQCKDLECLREVVTAYSRTQYKPGNIGLILDWYHGGVPKRTPNSINGASNGTHRRSNGFGRDAEPRDPEPEFIPDAEFLAKMERFNAARAGRAVAQWAEDELRNL